MGCLATTVLVTCLALAVGAGEKPLFDYADHYVMLNDFGRNRFYKNALANALPRCSSCRVLDLGAGSGLLAMLAAQLGAKDVLALEANPALASLANTTIEDNRHLFLESNIQVVPQLSSHLEPGSAAQPFDLLVTETFGTLLLGESALAFVSDARQRLLKPGGRIIPAGGCQYVSLVQLLDPSPWSPGSWKNINLSRWVMLQDTVYGKATFGASRFPVERMSERICALEVDLHRMSADDVPKNRTFRIQAQRDGIIHAVLFDWDIWADEQRTEVLSTAPGSRNFAGDVAWGWLLQLQEKADEQWQFQELPELLQVQAGEWLDMAVEFIAHGISIGVRLRPSLGRADAATSLPSFTSPLRIVEPGPVAVKESNEFLLPVAGDVERHDFYAAAIDRAVTTLGLRSPRVLDCSSAGLPGLYAASKGIRSVVMPRWKHVADVVRYISQENGLNDTSLEVLVGDPREMFNVLLPQGKADIVVVDPPGTPMHGMSPFAILPWIRKELLKEDGLVVPNSACLEVGLVESEELSHMFYIPKGRWDEVDLREWNREARRQGVLSRLVPYTKWLGSQSSLKFRWLSRPRCVYHMDLNAYALRPATKEETLDLELRVVDGLAHALVARWVVYSGSDRLGAESSYLGRDLTWPQYVQVVAKPGTDPGLLEPLPVHEGLEKLQLLIRQGSAKVTGAAGPEFTLRLLRAEPQGHHTRSLAEL